MFVAAGQPGTATTTVATSAASPAAGCLAQPPSLEPLVVQPSIKASLVRVLRATASVSL